MSECYFATGYVRLLYQLLQARRLPDGKLFQNTGYCAADLMRADFQMPFAAQMRFCQNAISLAPPGLGLQTGSQLQVAAHGVLGTALQSAPDLHAALTTFVQLLPSRASFYSLSMSRLEQRQRIEITMHSLPADLIPFFSESILFSINHCLAFYTGRHDNLQACYLNYVKPDYGSVYAQTFGGLVEFDSPRTSLVFDAGLLSLPSPEADPQVHADSVMRCKGQINGGQTDNLSERIESFLLDNPGRLWTIEEVASLFAVSPRTLMRRLKQVGTSYQFLRDNILKRQATIYLGAMTVEAAAISLGFADTSSFRRTFIRWFGVNPSAHVVSRP